MKKDNLRPVCITDFVLGDSLYVTVPENKRTGSLARTYLCEFQEMKSVFIVGKVIACETDSREKSMIGEIVNARLEHCSLYGENPVSNHTHFHNFNKFGYAIMPYEYEKDSENAQTITNHPSFAMIGFSHRTGSDRALFGSNISHSNGITITIKRGSVERKLNGEWFSGHEDLIEVELSAAQFAEFITSPNRGSGVPCTLTSRNGISIPHPPVEPKHEHNAQEFKNTMKNISADMINIKNELSTLLEKPTISKRDREQISSMFDSFIRTLNDKVPFVASRFGEHVQKTVEEAKMELEAFVLRKTNDQNIIEQTKTILKID